MAKLLRRWYVLLGLILLLGLAGSVALICSGRVRITQANFDRIQEGMSRMEVTQIIGDPDPEAESLFPEGYWRTWSSGPNWIRVDYFDDGKIKEKHLHLAGRLETLEWYAKKGAAKIGVGAD
jgi:hypothetical protein